jgi:hypothetical protein
MEFDIGDTKYLVSKLNAMDQLAVLRKISPVLASITPSSTEKINLASMAPVMQAVAGMSDENYDFVLNKCLSHVKRQLPNGGWADIWNREAACLMYEDITLNTMLIIIMNVMRYTFEDFFAAPLSSLNVEGSP